MIDILMITHNRPEYVRLALPHLLESCPPQARVWLWHNGTDEETLRRCRPTATIPGCTGSTTARSTPACDDRPTGSGRRRPARTWARSTTIVCRTRRGCGRCRPPTRTTPLRGHRLWRFPDADVDPDLVAEKLADYPGGHRLLRNHWIQGSGYLVKREVLDQLGPLRPRAVASPAVPAGGPRRLGQRLVPPVPARGAHGRPPQPAHHLPHRRRPAGPAAPLGPQHRLPDDRRLDRPDAPRRARGAACAAGPAGVRGVALADP